MPSTTQHYPPPERHYTVRLAVRPHLATFARNVCGSAPLIVHAQRDVVSQYILACLGRRSPDHGRLRHWCAEREEFLAYISLKQGERYGVHVDLRGHARFERLLQHLFHHTFAAHVQAHRQHGMEQQRAAEHFYHIHGIDPGHMDTEHQLRLLRQHTARRR